MSPTRTPLPAAFVLAAGLGTRLDPLTRLCAKPAVPLGDRTLIERLLAWLADEGVRDVVINLHHHPASVTRVVGDGRHLGLTARYAWEPVILGSAGGPRHALPLLDADPFFLVNADTLAAVDLGAMLDAHLSSGAAVTMAVIPNPAPDWHNGFLATADGVVTGSVPRGQADGSWHFIGIQVARAAVFASLPDGVPAEIHRYRDLLRAAPGAVRLFPVDGPVLDVGTPRDYLDAATRFPPAARPHVPASARIVRSVLWPTVTVDDDVDLEQCIAIGDVRLTRGFRARDVVIAPASIVSSADLVERHGPIALFPIGHAAHLPRAAG